MIVKTDRHTVLVVAGLTSLIVLVLLVRNVQDWRNPIRNRITDISVGTVWIHENTPSTSTVMARDPVSDYLYAQRRTIAYPTDEQDVEEYIKANRIDGYANDHAGPVRFDDGTLIYELEK